MQGKNKNRDSENFSKRNNSFQITINPLDRENDIG